MPGARHHNTRGTLVSKAGQSRRPVCVLYGGLGFVTNKALNNLNNSPASSPLHSDADTALVHTLTSTTEIR